MSACGACIGGGDIDGYAVCPSVKVIKPKKLRKCVECREPLPIGVECQKISGLYDGAWFAEYTCLPCAEIVDVYSCGDIPPAVGSMWEVWDDGAFQDMKMAGECWDKLSAPAKAKLLERWREWKGL